MRRENIHLWGHLHYPPLNLGLQLASYRLQLRRVSKVKSEAQTLIKGKLCIEWRVNLFSTEKLTGFEDVPDLNNHPFVFLSF